MRADKRVSVDETSQGDLLEGQAHATGHRTREGALANPRGAGQEQPQRAAFRAAQALRLDGQRGEFHNPVLDLVGADMFGVDQRADLVRRSQPRCSNAPRQRLGVFDDLAAHPLKRPNDRLDAICR